MTLDTTTLQVLDHIEEAAANAPETGAGGPALVREAPAEPALGLPMEVLGTYEGAQIDSGVIFGGEGHSHSHTRKQDSPQYKRKLAEAARLYKEVLDGRRTMMWLHESMMSSEFSALLGDTMDRVLLAKYQTYAPSYRQFLRGRTVRDFRAVKSIRRTTGGRLAAVPEGGTYPHGSALAESSFSFAVAKYGQTYELSWEMIVNDDIDAFSSLPDDMADDAIQTEMYLASALYVANTTLFATNHSHNGSTYSNKGTAALAPAALQAAIAAMLLYPGDVDKPLNNQPIWLVVPPTLEMEAFKILRSTIVQFSGGDSTTGIAAVGYPTHNILAGRLQVVVDPYIQVLDATNGYRSWYLFSDPARIHGAEYAFLRGYEQPQLFMRAPNALRLGGGQADGDFDNDGRGYKVRHVFGGSHANAAGGWRACYWSDGTA